MGVRKLEDCEKGDIEKTSFKPEIHRIATAPVSIARFSSQFAHFPLLALLECVTSKRFHIEIYGFPA